jgi:hypothetical protein
MQQEGLVSWRLILILLFSSSAAGSLFESVVVEKRASSD